MADGKAAICAGPSGSVRCDWDADLYWDADRLGLLDAGAVEVTGADDPEAARADLSVGDHRQPADLVPAEALDLEGVHPNLGSRERAARVVLVDRLGDRPEILGFRAHDGNGSGTPVDPRAASVLFRNLPEVGSERVYGDPSGWDHAVAHVDMDAFYVSVELLRRPELRGKPVIVGPRDPNSRGVVMTASYEARRFGVGSAMPIAIARRRCPDAVIISGDMASYREVSQRVMAILHTFSERVEVAGLDEAYVDLGDSPTPKTRARQLKREVRAQTGLTCSIGLGPNRLIAKIASDLDKPDGLCILPRERFLEVIGDRPARIIPGVGPKTEERLRRAGIRTVAELSRADEGLERSVGPKHAESLRLRARGFGGTAIGLERVRKSESREHTFAVDEGDPVVMREAIEAMARTVASHLGEQSIRGRTVTLKIRLAPFRTFTRSRTLPGATCEPDIVAAAALELFGAFERDAPVRLLGVGVSSLEHESGPLPRPPDPVREAGLGPQQLPLG